MIIKECIQFAAQSLGLEAIALALAQDDSAAAIENLSDAERGDLNTLFESSKAVVHEVAAEYIPLVTRGEFEAEKNKLLFSSFCHDVVEVKHVTTTQGVRVNFRNFHNRIETDRNGTLTVEYSFVPKIEDMGTVLLWKNDRVSVRNLGYGIAAEFYVRNGAVDDAVLWDRRFKGSIRRSMRESREMRVRRRRWL